MSSRASRISWGESASLAVVGHSSSDGVTKKIPYVVDVLQHCPASHPIYSFCVFVLVKTESDFIIISVERLA